MSYVQRFRLAQYEIFDIKPKTDVNKIDHFLSQTIAGSLCVLYCRPSLVHQYHGHYGEPRAVGSQPD